MYPLFVTFTGVDGEAIRINISMVAEYSQRKGTETTVMRTPAGVREVLESYAEVGSMIANAIVDDRRA